MAGGAFSMGLKSDGSVVAWGLNGSGQCNVPLPNLDFAAVAAGSSHCVGLKTDGSIIAWGSNYDSWGEYTGQCVVPSPNTGFKAVAAGGFASLAVKGLASVPVYLSRFSAERRGSAAVINWVVMQPHTLSGFRLWRQESGGERVPISSLLSGGQESYEFLDASLPSGSAEYWLQEIAADGAENWYGPAHLEAAPVPPALHLYPNAPNPFNPRTTIRFDLPVAGQAQLSIYDLAGRLVRVLVEGEVPAGSHEAVWDGRDASGRSAPSGSYLARLVAGGKVEGVRLSLVR
jgi:hypothetical protein